MMTIQPIETTKAPYRISTDASQFDLEKSHAMIAGSYWATNIPFEIYKRSVENSLSFGIYHEIDGQVGLARVISDYATYAYLADVFILDEHRGHGLGKWLIQTISDHPNLQEIRSFYLQTADAHGLYEQYGWERLADPGRTMVKRIFQYE